MASIFDQYESQQRIQQATQEVTGSSKSSVATALFRNLKLEDDSPIFSKQRINFQPNSDIVQLVVSNNRLVLALMNNILIRINLLQPQDIEEIDLSRYCSQKGKVYKLFLDASGQHLIVSLSNNTNGDPLDTLYIPWQTKKVRVINKLKSHMISSVAWSQRNSSEMLTGPIVCGTMKALLFEIELSSDESMFQSGLEPYCKQLVDLGKREEITGVEILPCPTDDLEYVILCCTKSRLYSFRGHITSTENRPLFLGVFSNYKDSLDNYVEFKGNNSTAALKLYYQPSTMMANSFAWTTSHGVYYGVFNWSLQGSSIGDETKLLKVARDPGSSKLLSQDGVGLVVTPFHLLIPHDNEISVVCVLSEKVLVNDRIPNECGAAVGISQDSIKGTIWLYASKGIFKCKMDREDRNVWKTYLDQHKFEQSRKYCYGDQMKLLQVRMKEAELLFEKGDYVESAKLFAYTLVPFEQVFFKLNSVEDDTGLRVFLMEKLNMLAENEKGQYSLVALIMLEYYFKRLGQIRDNTSEGSNEYNKLNNEFEAFLNKPRILKTLKENSNAVYHLLSSHADKTNIIKICRLIKAYNRVVTHLINTNRHMEALEILSEHSSEDLMLQHLPTLLKAIPVPTVEFIISKGHKLDPLKMVPILIQVHASRGCSSEVKRYLEHCIDDMERTESVLHNFLITIYATEYPSKLLPYLKLQGDNMDSVCYDTKLALRECLAVKQDIAAVHILTVMGMYQEAVELALKTDVDLAKATAERQRNTPQLCKKLWLLITRFLVEKSQDVEKALAIMKECELIKIEDILPFFPDFVTIDLFKDAICQSLNQYNKEIEQLKEEMEEASGIADEMRADITLLKQEHTSISPDDTCIECSTGLLDRPFYIFQCTHKFHQDCLCDAVLEYMTAPEKQQVLQLRARLLSLSSDDGRISRSAYEERARVRAQLDDLVACECLYCGDRFVECIDRPFLAEQDWRKVVDDWN
uniref:Vacuolar protein sorting-associated protein 18 homolog n=2 Tax=Hirondellea gigas TaxID=1518452 RepID=A0A6A7G726_9CRUS